MKESIWVIKLNLQRKETWRYSASLIRQDTDSILVEARFNRDDMVHFGMPLGRGDRFVERFFSRRWYNIFEVHDREDDRLKGWYCNICLPAEMDNDQVSYVDLALDLLVFPDGRQVVLDEDEFAALPLPPQQRATALAALQELRELFSNPAGFSLDQKE